MNAGPIYEMLRKMTREQLESKGVECEPEVRESLLRSFDLAGLVPPHPLSIAALLCVLCLTLSGTS